MCNCVCIYVCICVYIDAAVLCVYIDAAVLCVRNIVMLEKDSMCLYP